MKEPLSKSKSMREYFFVTCAVRYAYVKDFWQHLKFFTYRYSQVDNKLFEFVKQVEVNNRIFGLLVPDLGYSLHRD